MLLAACEYMQTREIRSFEHDNRYCTKELLELILMLVSSEGSTNLGLNYVRAKMYKKKMMKKLHVHLIKPQQDNTY